MGQKMKQLTKQEERNARRLNKENRLDAIIVRIMKERELSLEQGKLVQNVKDKIKQIYKGKKAKSDDIIDRINELVNGGYLTKFTSVERTVRITYKTQPVDFVHIDFQ